MGLAAHISLLEDIHSVVWLLSTWKWTEIVVWSGCECLVFSLFYMCNYTDYVPSSAKTPKTQIVEAAAADKLVLERKDRTVGYL